MLPTGSTLAVTLYLPTEVYVPVERKATAAGIPAGRLLTGMVCAALEPKTVRGKHPQSAPGSTPKPRGRRRTRPYRLETVPVRLPLPMTVVPQLEAIAARRGVDLPALLLDFVCRAVLGAEYVPAGQPATRSRSLGFDQLTAKDQAKFLKMTADNKTLDEIGAALKVHAGTAGRWRRRAIAAGDVIVTGHRTANSRTGYDKMSAEDQAEFRRMVSERATPLELATRFGQRSTSVTIWAKKLVKDGTVTLAPKTGTRRYVRVSPADIPKMVRMFANPDTNPTDVAKRFGISEGSVANWKRKLADQIGAYSFDVDECQWCGSAATGVAYQTDEHTYPAPSCGQHGYDFAEYAPIGDITHPVAVPA